MWWEEQGWLLEIFQSIKEVPLTVQERGKFGEPLKGSLLTYILVWDCCGRPQVLLWISDKNGLLITIIKIIRWMSSKAEMNGDVELSSNLLLLDFGLRWTEYWEIPFLSKKSMLLCSDRSGHKERRKSWKYCCAFLCRPRYLTIGYQTS